MRIDKLAGRTTVVLLCLFLVAPLAVVVATAFTTTPYLTFPPRGLTLKWFDVVLSDPSWRAALLNSALLAAGSTLIACLVGTPAAIALTKRGVAASNLIGLLIVAPIVVPSIMYTLGLMLAYSKISFTPQPWTLAVAISVLATPYFMRTLMAGLESIDPSLEIAAMNLGASRLRAWRDVVLPAVIRSFVSGALLAFIISFDELIVPLFLARPTDELLPVRIYDMIAYDIDPSIAAVSAILIVVTCVLVVISARDTKRAVEPKS